MKRCVWWFGLFLAAAWGWLSVDAQAGDGPTLRVAAFRCDVTPRLGFLSYPPCFKPLEKIEHPGIDIPAAELSVDVNARLQVAGRFLVFDFHGSS